MANALRRWPAAAVVGGDGAVEVAKAVLAQAGYEVWRAPGRRSFTGFLQAVQRRDQATLEKAYRTGYRSWPAVAKAAMGETAGAAGGYLVPPDYTTAILHAISEESFIYP